MINLPGPVAKYLLAHNETGRCAGYVCLDHEGLIANAAGQLGDTRLSALHTDTPLEQQVPLFAGLLPAGADATVINNIQMENSCYIDLHMFKHDANTWVVFIDQTSLGNRLQKEQQRRLNIDYDQDKKRVGK